MGTSASFAGIQPDRAWRNSRAAAEAHLDGLLIGGRDVAVRLLEPELENETEPMRASIAALVLLLSQEKTAANMVLDAVRDAEGSLQEALGRALVLSNAARLDRILMERFRETHSESEKAVWL